MLTLRDRVREELKRLAAGGDPYRPDCGICHNLSWVVAGGTDSTDEYDDVYRWVGATCAAMGLHHEFPIERDQYAYARFGKWEGERGQQRRKLCTDLLAYVDKLI